MKKKQIDPDYCVYYDKDCRECNNCLISLRGRVGVQSIDHCINLGKNQEERKRIKEEIRERNRKITDVMRTEKKKEVKYVENSKEIRGTIQKGIRPFEKRGICSWCGKVLPNKRWMWCREEKNPDKYGKCIGKYLATKGAYYTEACRLNREKYSGDLTCERCKTQIKDLDIPAGDNRYDYDHIIPIALGGDPVEVNNIQILCVKCHKVKTKEDIAKIAEQRQIVKAEKIKAMREKNLDKINGKKSHWSSLSEF